MKTVAVILPTYNEEENIAEIIRLVLDQQKNVSKDYRLVVVVSDSHSPDKTGQVVKDLGKKDKRITYLDVKKRGIGVGLIEGIRHAKDKLKADIIIQMDADLSHDPSAIPIFLDKINEGYDLVLGSRFIRGGENKLEFYRKFLSWSASMVVRILSGMFKVKEWTTSYRAFTVDRFNKIDLTPIPWQSATFVTQPAFAYYAILSGAKYTEVPIVFVDRRAGYSKMQIFRYIIDVVSYFSKIRMEKHSTLIKFLVVGTVGYLVNSISLGLLNRGEINFADKFVIPHFLSQPLFGFIPLSGQVPHFLFIELDRLFYSSILAIELSIFSNFLLHENWTFADRDRKGNIFGRFLKFNVTSAVSPIIQLITILVLHNLFNVHEQVGLIIGILIGLSWNWMWNTRVVWKEKSK